VPDATTPSGGRTDRWRTDRIEGAVFHSLLPAWFRDGLDLALGCTRERLDGDRRPVPGLPDRLVSQARVVFSYAESLSALPDARVEQFVARGFEYMCAQFWDARTGGWRYARGGGSPGVQTRRDLYAHAFVALACAAYYRATRDPRAIAWADVTLHYVRDNLRHGAGGFVTALSEDRKRIPGPLLQNPHMHLFEACCFLFEVTRRDDYLGFGAELVELLLERLIEPRTGTVTEYFDDSWRPAADRGDVLEPGHHFEWVWLVHRWLRIVPPAYRERHAERLLRASDRMLRWALQHGVDRSYRGVYDEVARSGGVLKDTKRIWPVTEALKAVRFASAGGSTVDGLEPTYDDLESLVIDRYVDTAAGSWSEVLSRDLRPAVAFMPATTLYHLVMMVRELAWERRGPDAR
jgi:mannose-6-phosphate isomerase